MAAIDQSFIDEFFAIVQRVRDGLPIIETVAETLDPELAPEIELARAGQTALFELLSRLQSAAAVELEAEKATLRDETIAAWRSKA
jgi:hypothetical protein